MRRAEFVARLAFGAALTLALARAEPARSQPHAGAGRGSSNAEVQSLRRGLTAAHPLPLLGSDIEETTTLTNGDYVATAVWHEAPRPPLDRGFVSGGPLSIRLSERPQSDGSESIRIALNGRVVYSAVLAGATLRRGGDRTTPTLSFDASDAHRRVLVVAPMLEIRYVPAARGFRPVARDAGEPFVDLADYRATGYHRVRRSRWKSIEARIDERGFGSGYPGPGVQRLEVSIVRSGRVGFESVGHVDDPSPRGSVVPIETGPTFVRFARGEPPTMMFTGYTGGAHCCLISRAYATPAIGPIHGEQAFWGDASTGPHIAYDRRSGRFVVVWWREPGDYPFVEPGPLELWSFEHGRFRNVTQNFVDLVRLQAEDAFDTLRSALHARLEQPERPSLDGTQLDELADAFIEDEYVAGEGREGRRRFEALDMTDADRHWLTLFIDRYPSEVRARPLIDARW